MLLSRMLHICTKVVQINVNLGQGEILCGCQRNVGGFNMDMSSGLKRRCGSLSDNGERARQQLELQPCGRDPKSIVWKVE